MTIQEMHIGIDLGLQRLNSNLFGKLLPQVKDYFINTTTLEFVRAALTDEKHSIFDTVTYQDIRTYYEKLQNYIRTIQLGLINEYGRGYVYGKLPNSIATNNGITDGLLYDGAIYKVINSGNTDLSNFGYKSVPVSGETFVCDINTIYSNNVLIEKDSIYRLVNPAHGNFTTVGAPNNNSGTEFIATNSAGILTTGLATVKPLALKPDWNSTELMLIGDIGYFINISSFSSIKYGNPIQSGSLKAGTKYIIDIQGNTDLSYFGVSTATPDYIFPCEASGTPNWDGVTTLYEIKDIGNRLVKYQDINSFLDNSFGTSSKDSPISVLANNELRVYHNNKFDIKRINLDYIRKPISVNYELNIDSDLPDSVQPFVIDLIVKRIMAYSGNPAYNAVLNETREENKQ